jgi:uncharacterized protein (TIGR01244 family)
VLSAPSSKETEMTPSFIAVTQDFAVSPQLQAQDMAHVAAQGFHTVVNNRPDGEGGEAQPRSADLALAAQAEGLHYVYLPVVGGAITPEQAQAMAEVLRSMPGPILAFCRSGARSAQLFSLASTGR